MTVMSTEESLKQEQCSLVYQLLLDFLSFSASSFSSMAKYSVVTDKESMEVIEEFILEQLKNSLEQLNLTKGTISEIKPDDHI
ncbi:hypothetical protein ES332_D04G140200v1 [Gossypium tomentosum]|uniref:Uncharacterized protein n=1 Tax=Gossypium tomentosum TaxID=34277 RepID=A0A5D2LD39_GOSTO|nr:hypothetical protein ES332_D04G140200v1 [Gossypium tomentosum]